MFRRLLHIFLVVSLVSSTMGISLIEQFCQMRGLSVAAFDHPVDCMGEKPFADEHGHSSACCAAKQFHATPHFSAPPCCDDAGKWLQHGANTTPPSVAKYLVSGIAPAAILEKPIVHSLYLPHAQVFAGQNHGPPPLGKQIRVMHQSFLC